MIQNLVTKIMQIASEGDERAISIGRETGQRYIEYLDALQDKKKLTTGESIIVKVDGTTIKFKNLEDFSQWIVNL